jgi:hypothetical protein
MPPSDGRPEVLRLPIKIETVAEIGRKTQAAEMVGLFGYTALIGEE